MTPLKIVNRLVASVVREFFATLLMIIIILFIARDVKAGLQTQQCTNWLSSFSTNTFKIVGDVSGSFTNGETATGNTFIDCSGADDVYFAVGGFFTNSTATSSNVTFRLAQSVDLFNWTNSAVTITLVVPALTTNWVVSHSTVQNAAPGYALRAIESINGAAVNALVNTMYLKAYTKKGI